MFTLAGWCLDRGLLDQEQTQSDYCGFGMSKCNETLRYLMTDQSRSYLL